MLNDNDWGVFLLQTKVDPADVGIIADLGYMCDNAICAFQAIC